ncbi:MAG: protein-L-isoaspartate O-methyltransferase family protein [Pseudomonadota bacterium]
MSADFAAARQTMVESQVRTADVTDLALQDALRATPRERLLPAAKAFAAYADVEVEYAPGRWLLKPRDVAKLLQALRPVAGETALAIAAPYAAAVLEAMGLSVTRLDEGDLKRAPGGDYDLVVCEGAVARAPEAWTSALALGGRLGVVERDGPAGRAMVYVRAADGVGGRAVFDASPPHLAGFEPVRGFAF